VSEATQLLQSVTAGNPRAAEELLALVYDELRVLARMRLAVLAPGQTLQATALVHEVYLRLIDRPAPAAGWQDTRHFFFAAARAMHDILVERARQKASLKRGGGRGRIDLKALSVDSPPDELLALAEALDELKTRDARKHELVMLRFFAGCTAGEAASAMDISASTANREWRIARAWLHQQLSERSGRTS
jgi:RNA polymerase sigma factor (TIGR02999 family)